MFIPQNRPLCLIRHNADIHSIETDEHRLNFDSRRLCHIHLLVVTGRHLTLVLLYVETKSRKGLEKKNHCILLSQYCVQSIT